MDVLKLVSDTVTQKPTKFKVHILKPTKRERVLFFFGLKKRYQLFEIKPLCLGTTMRISKLLLSIDTKEVKKDELIDVALNLMSKSKIQAKIIALAVTNSERLPDIKLVKFLLFNLNSKELNDLVNIVIGGMDITNFLKSIISVRGAHVLSQMSPTDQVEKIAPGILSAVS
jgi:hypothetical protein